MAPKKGTKRVVKQRPPVNMSILQTAIIEPSQMGRFRRTRGERDEQQKAFDKIVDLAWKEWDNAGQPSDWNSVPGTWLSVAETDYETAKFMIEKAGRFYHFKITFGRVERQEVTNEDGSVTPYATFVFTAIDFPAGEAEPESEEDEEDEEIAPEVLDSRALELYGKRYDELTDEEAQTVLDHIENDEQDEASALA
jgi:hypothetical protein